MKFNAKPQHFKCLALSDSATRFSTSVFFMNQFPPSPWVYHLGRFEYFQKFAEINAAQGAPPVSLTDRFNP